MATVPTKKTRSLKSWSKRNLPDELWSEIFPYLPVKSLLRFRTVSPSWLSLIDSPALARSHLARFPNNKLQSRLFVIDLTYRVEECVVRCSKTLRLTSRLGFLQSNSVSVGTLRTSPSNHRFVERWTVLCSIDGLLLLKNWQTKQFYELMLWNPSIKKTRILPAFIGGMMDSRNIDFGLGFDPVVGDYKHVRFVVNGTGGLVYVAVYRVGVNSWKAVGFQGGESWTRSFRFASEQKTLSIGGVIYGLANDTDVRPLKLVSFDLSTEVFDATALPACDGLNSVFFSQELAVVDGGCSVAVVYLVHDKGSVWVLEWLGGGGGRLSWIQRYTFSMGIAEYDPLSAMSYFFFLKKNGEMLLRWLTMVESYNLETREEKIVHKNVLCRGKAWPYIESLILLH